MLDCRYSLSKIIHTLASLTSLEQFLRVRERHFLRLYSSVRSLNKTETHKSFTFSSFCPQNGQKYMLKRKKRSREVKLRSNLLVKKFNLPSPFYVHKCSISFEEGSTWNPCLSRTQPRIQTAKLQNKGHRVHNGAGNFLI